MPTMATGSCRPRRCPSRSSSSARCSPVRSASRPARSGTGRVPLRTAELGVELTPYLLRTQALDAGQEGEQLVVAGRRRGWRRHGLGEYGAVLGTLVARELAGERLDAGEVPGGGAR